MKHTIEELGDFAEDNADGHVFIWKTSKDARGRHSSVSEPWSIQIGKNGETHHGETPDVAVDKAMEAHERARNPDGYVGL